ncbi:DUF1150 family protein [Thalassobius sp. MITS945101]|uniref:DUF1150 family protein n=1 Tax=Thalassobius sp. MITS945101 TaxID=3096994 RepID=UPI00399BB1D1
MNTKLAIEGFDLSGEAEIVYVRPVRVMDLPLEVREQAGGREVLYEVARPDGEQLALTGDRETAYYLAEQHDLSPVTLH